MKYPGNIQVTIFLPLGLPIHCFSKYYQALKIIIHLELKKITRFQIKNSSNPWGGTSLT